MISPKSIQFITDLKANNNREWFLANKKDYDLYKADYQQLVQTLLDRMKPLDPSLDPLEVKNCTFRINRDIRFSHDKTPYKNHLGIWMSPGAKGQNFAGYYLHISDDECFIAGGLYNPEAADLKKVRQEIAYFYEDFRQIIEDKTFKRIFGKPDTSNSLKTSPKDFEKDHPAIEFLRLKSFTATKKFDCAEVTKPEFADKISQQLIALKPLNDFINRALTAPE
jgi:uncharacterized protein (TIGR02453 family)